MSLYTISKNRISPNEITKPATTNNSAKERWVKGTKKIGIMNRLRLPSSTPSNEFIIHRSRRFEIIFLNKYESKVTFVLPANATPPSVFDGSSLAEQ